MLIFGIATVAFASDDQGTATPAKGSNEVELVFIVDKSGSMAGLESDTIGGFNSMLNKQKEAKGSEAFVTTVLFDTNYNLIHDRVPLDRVENLTTKEYIAGGNTALLDAVGTTINRLAHVPGIYDNGRRVLFVIITDGYENSSREFTRDQVKNLITTQKKEHDWEFMFLGANIDAAGEANKIGITQDRAATYSNDTKGVQTNYASLNDVVASLRNNQKISADWKKNIEQHNSQKK